MALHQRILVVDDEADWKQDLAKRVKSAGYEPIVPEGRCDELIANALAICDEVRIDLAIVDLRLCMPANIEDRSGYRLIVELKERFPELSVLAKTVYPPNAEIVNELLSFRVGKRSRFADGYFLSSDLMSKEPKFEDKLAEELQYAVGTNFALDIELSDDELSVILERLRRHFDH